MLKVVDKFSIPIITALLCVVYITATRKMDWIVIRYPYVIIAIIALLWICIMIDELRLTTSSTQKKEEVSIKQFVSLAAPALLYLVAIDILGYFTSTLLFIGSLMFLLGNRNIKQIILITCLFVGLQYLFFGILLNLPIPEGLLL